MITAHSNCQALSRPSMILIRLFDKNSLNFLVSRHREVKIKRKIRIRIRIHLKDFVMNIQAFMNTGSNVFECVENCGS